MHRQRRIILELVHPYGPTTRRLAGLEPLKDDNILERSTRRVILRKIRTHEIRTYYAVFPGSAAPTMVVSTGQNGADCAALQAQCLVFRIRSVYCLQISSLL